MKKTEEIKPTHSCEFCNRKFIKEKTLITHICETKNRWLDKDKQGNRIAYQSFLQFYTKHTTSKKLKTYEEFIKSAYYIAFVKFGNYCINVNVINISRYVDWLLSDGIKLDNWCSDTNYTKFLIEYLRKENAFDAIHRGVETTMEWSEKENILHKDYLRYGNVNRICQLITVGKISPWLLYQSESGPTFLDTLSPDHVKMIMDYINPEQWALKFNREPDITKQIRETLRVAGY
jgi:hypothetical protein